MFHKSVTALTCLSMLSLAACGGRTANPVMVSQYGDANKSCKALMFELQTVENEMRRLLPESDKTGENVALGVAGAFLIVPWFFMDFSAAEEQEYNAYRQRYNHLAAIATDKNCGGDITPLPSIEEMKSKQVETNEPRYRR